MSLEYSWLERHEGDHGRESTRDSAETTPDVDGIEVRAIEDALIRNRG